MELPTAFVFSRGRTSAAGRLSIEDMRKIQDWLAHIGLPTALVCPLCGETSWTVGNNLYTFFLNAEIVGLPSRPQEAFLA